MFEMASPSSPPLGYVLKDHPSRDSHRRRPPTHSSKSQSRSPSSQSWKINVKETANDSNNHRRSCNSCQNNNDNNNNNQDEVPPPSPLMSRRQARVLDQWATQQARETIISIERRKHSDFDISSLSDSNNNNYVSYRSHPTSRDTSPAPSDSSSVSSLVQKWKEFETSDTKQPPNNQNHNHNQNQNQNQNEGGNSGACSILVSRANSVTSSIENDSINNWEPDQTPAIENSAGDADKERLRVVDIIKKLPLVQCEKVSTVCSPAVLSSPRIRGRQAVADLFAKQERDRYSEIEATCKRQPVSKFPKRGPLQTMLKLRALRREVSSQDQPPRVYESSNKPERKIRASSSINNIRERFNPALPKCDDSVKTIKSAQQGRLINTDSVMEKASTSNKPTQTTKEETRSSQLSNAASEANHKERDDSEIIKTTKEEQEDGKMEKTDKMLSSEEAVPQLTTTEEAEEEEGAQPEMILSSNVIWPETRNGEEAVNCDPLETNNVPSYVVWDDQRIYEDEEQEGVYDDYDYCGPYLDWINDVSRPRSYWESLRQAWYQEVFTSSSKNEIKQLIESGSVSNVLASDFPDKMDRIMSSSSMRRQSKPEGYNDEDESQFPITFTQSQMQPLGIPLEEEQQDHHDLQEQHFTAEEAVANVEERRNGQEQEIAREKVVGGNEEEEPESSGSNQYNNGAFYDEQAQASSSHLPWTNYDNQEYSDNSEQFEPTPHQEQSSITNSFDQDTQGGSSSCKNNSSIEMELIYDFRAHMEQMYREISELRTSVNNCVDIQEKLRSSIKDEVSAAISHSGSNKANGKESNGKVPKKGWCCICYENKVDSVLYRCGHMCACFKCGHELQLSSGKCPICQSQIADVVRVYTEEA